MSAEFRKLEANLKVSFNNKELLQQAFTHRSFINEHKGTDRTHNERLEFLGDAVLELVVTDYLFKTFTANQEGDLTAYRSSLVNSDILASISTKLGFDEYLLLSKGETKDKGRARTYILANTFEAFVGALYIDQGYEAANSFILEHLVPNIGDIISKRLFIDAKSQFQAKAQEFVAVTPTYKSIKETGPDHDKHFTIGVYIGKEQILTGEGKSKQDAEQDAARKALEIKGW